MDYWIVEVVGRWGGAGLPPHHSNTPLLQAGFQNLITSFICPHWEQRERSTSWSSV